MMSTDERSGSPFFPPINAGQLISRQTTIVITCDKDELEIRVYSAPVRELLNELRAGGGRGVYEISQQHHSRHRVRLNQQ